MREDLEKVFDFDPSDLIMNQNGRLSEKQIRLISVYQQMGKFFGRMAFVVMLLSFGLIGFITFYNIGIDLEKNPAPIAAFAAVFSLGMLLFIFSMLLGKLRPDLKSGKISTAEGFAEKNEKKMRRHLGTAYFVKIGKVKFQVDEKTKYQAIQPNGYYRFFYIKNPPTQIILSVEEISRP